MDMEGIGVQTMIVHASAMAGARAVPWLESFAIGHDSIDDEHHRLIDSFNEFCVLAAAEVPAAEIRSAACTIIAKVESHFASEEALFPMIGYRRRLSHMREHLDVARKLNMLLLDGTGMEPALAASAGRIVVVEHILRHDLAFKTWVMHATGQ